MSMAILTRRGALRAAGAAAALIPMSAMAPWRRSPEVAPGDFPICHVADTPDAAAGPAKTLKLTWNANAICTVGAPMADLRGRSIAANRGSIAHALILAVAEAQGWSGPDTRFVGRVRGAVTVGGRGADLGGRRQRAADRRVVSGRQ